MWWSTGFAAAVVIFHGGHMRAGLALGEDVYTDLGYTVPVPSRPGYGRTPLSAGFADVTRELCRHLGIKHIAATAGISACHPDRVARLILQSAVGPLLWPSRRTAWPRTSRSTQ